MEEEFCNIGPETPEQLERYRQRAEERRQRSIELFSRFFTPEEAHALTHNCRNLTVAQRQELQSDTIPLRLGVEEDSRSPERIARIKAFIAAHLTNSDRPA